MKAVYITEYGGPEKLEIRDVDEPAKPSGRELLVKVTAAGLNRADLLQRQGFYPPPKGFSPNIPGLEFAGEVIAAGENAEKHLAGDRVFGITAGEAQAEFVLVDERHAAKVPAELSDSDAAAIPEVFITAHDALFTQARLSAGETLLIHAVGSGVGLAALQLANAAGAKTIGTSRTASKLEKCREFGLGRGVLAGRSIEFAGAVSDATNGSGPDVILDLVGAAYFRRNLQCIATKGRIMLVGLTGGTNAEFDLGAALTKRIAIIGTALRSRTADEKAAAVSVFESDVVPLFSSGVLRPVIDKVFDVRDVAAAHEYLASNESFGKVVLKF